MSFFDSVCLFSIIQLCHISSSNISMPSRKGRNQGSDSGVELSHTISMPMSERSMSEPSSDDISSSTRATASISKISGCLSVNLDDPIIWSCVSPERDESWRLNLILYSMDSSLKRRYIWKIWTSRNNHENPTLYIPDWQSEYRGSDRRYRPYLLWSRSQLPHLTYHYALTVHIAGIHHDPWCPISSTCEMISATSDRAIPEGACLERVFLACMGVTRDRSYDARYQIRPDVSPHPWYAKGIHRFYYWYRGDRSWHQGTPWDLIYAQSSPYVYRRYSMQYERSSLEDTESVDVLSSPWWRPRIQYL